MSFPFYFKWIHHELRPWEKVGITLDNVEPAIKFMSLILGIVEGRLFIESYRKSFQTRDLFTISLLAWLLKIYLGMLPVLELMFNGNTTPLMNGNRSMAPVPLFF